MNAWQNSNHKKSNRKNYFTDAYRFFVDGTPPSVNHAYQHSTKGKRFFRFPTKEFKEWKRKVGIAFLKKYPDHEPLKNECEVIIRVYYADARRRDIDNAGKAVLDSMNKLVYDDDFLVKKLEMEKFIDRESPRTEIIILTKGV